ncbi:MAG: hypothetical protein MZV49_26300 [Rhodopseudomonas palustris]|nr:hypothetical protein [Rhodopseudomonas palustris]
MTLSPGARLRRAWPGDLPCQDNADRPRPGLQRVAVRPADLHVARGVRQLPESSAARRAPASWSAARTTPTAVTTTSAASTATAGSGSACPRRRAPRAAPAAPTGSTTTATAEVDGEDPGCQACQENADCDDGKPCNGLETCVDFACVAGTPVVHAVGHALPGLGLRRQHHHREPLHPAAGRRRRAVRRPRPVHRGRSVYRWQLRRDVEDCATAPPCTVDHCDPVDGTCVHTPDDGLCPGADVCNPGCFATATGCGLPPVALSLTCQSPAPAPYATTCTVDLAGGAARRRASRVPPGRGRRAVLQRLRQRLRRVRARRVELRRHLPCNDTNSMWCVTGFAGTPALQVDKKDCSGKTVIVERTVDLTGLQRAEFCFSYADHGAGGGNDYLKVEYDPSGTGTTLTQLFNDVDGPLPGVDDTWLRYCIELPADRRRPAGPPHPGDAPLQRRQPADLRRPVQPHRLPPRLRAHEQPLHEHLRRLLHDGVDGDQRQRPVPGLQGGRARGQRRGEVVDPRAHGRHHAPPGGSGPALRPGRGRDHQGRRLLPRDRRHGDLEDALPPDRPAAPRPGRHDLPREPLRAGARHAQQPRA